MLYMHYMIVFWGFPLSLPVRVQSLLHTVTVHR